jgi:cellulose biosynthesis protein BcsQ
MARVMVPFANGKGGVGKTALACSYAAARAHEGADVILFDTNEEQRTAMAWSEVRDFNNLLPKIRVQPGSVQQALEMRGRCDVLVVDTPGWTDRGTLLLAKKATFMVIPTGPNPTYDLQPTVRLLHGLRQEGIETWRLGVVFSRFSADETICAEELQVARKYLQDAHYRALDGCIRNVSAYSAALAVGYGLTETQGLAKLRDEASHLMDVITKGMSSAVKRDDRDRGSPERGKEKDIERGGRE